MPTDSNGYWPKAEPIKVQFLPPKMKTKYLRVTMPDGSKWDVPADLIAQHRAAYFLKDRSAPEFDKQVQWDLDHPENLIEWAEGDMNWSDVRIHATRVFDGSVDYQDGWVNGEKEVVEK